MRIHLPESLCRMASKRFPGMCGDPCNLQHKSAPSRSSIEFLGSTHGLDVITPSSHKKPPCQVTLNGHPLCHGSARAIWLARGRRGFLLVLFGRGGYTGLYTQASYPKSQILASELPHKSRQKDTYKGCSAEKACVYSPNQQTIAISGFLDPYLGCC